MKQILEKLLAVLDFFTFEYEVDYVLLGRIFGVVVNIYNKLLEKEHLPKFLVFIFFIPLWIIAFFLESVLITLFMLFAAVFVFPIIGPIYYFFGFIYTIKEKSVKSLKNKIGLL